MRNVLLYATLILLLSVDRAVADITIEQAQLQKDVLLAKELQNRITCDESEHAENPTCTFNYQGTRVEIVNSTEAKLPNIFIRSIGKGQSILPRGSRCIEIFFENRSFRGPGYLLNVGMLLHSSGKVWPSLDLELRQKCESG